MGRTNDRLSSSIIKGALNFTNGETVAVKQIQLTNIPKAEVDDIMVSGPSTSCLEGCESLLCRVSTVRNPPTQEPQCQSRRAVQGASPSTCEDLL